MNSRIKYMIFGLALVLPGCGHLLEKCGDNVLLGEFNVTTESVTDWFPYESTDQLVFSNDNNEKLILKQDTYSTFMEVESGKTLCWEEAWDNSSEFIRTEWIETKYFSESHELKISMHAGWHWLNSSYGLDELFDHVFYSSRGEQMGGGIDLVANDRGNNIDMDIYANPSVIHADEIRINGQLFEDVWYFNREYPPSVFTPSLYVKKGIGILAFTDDDYNVWLINN